MLRPKNELRNNRISGSLLSPELTGLALACAIESMKSSEIIRWAIREFLKARDVEVISLAEALIPEGVEDDPRT